MKKLGEKDGDYICYQDLFIDRQNSGKKAVKISNNITQLMKIAFETECKYVIKNVSLANLEMSERKIKKLFKRINKQTGRIDFEISEELLELKLRELTLNYELNEKQQEEKERRKIQAEDERKMKNAEKAKQKLEEAEEREKRYQEKLEAALNKQNSIVIREKQKLEQEVSQLKKLVEEAHTETEKAQASYRRAMTKKGYIYILSNIGVLGEDIYRICMTQSTPPESYIDRMNPMVPFPFDIHIKLFSQDSSGTLRQLHQRFASQRINLVNDRRDFFKISFNEIIQAIEEIDNSTGLIAVEGEPMQTPEANEYMKSKALERQHIASGNLELKSESDNQRLN
ncbi:T5orf172 domain-containing protein [Leptolyngbya sp. PCC 7375]|nr:T5orf172 domain-containing protein [Leptolyngbya sp. PCC 7375]